LSSDAPKNRRLNTFLKLGLAIGLFVGLATTVGWTRIYDTLRQADLRLIVFALLLACLCRLMQALQMSVVLRQIRTPIPPHRVLYANSQATLYGLVIPGDVAASIAKWSHLSTYTGKRSLVLNAMIYNRVMSFSPWIFTGLLAISLRNPWEGHHLLVAGILIACLFAFTFVIFYHPISGPHIDGWVSRLSQKSLPIAVHTRVSYLISSMQPFRQSHGTAHAQIMLLGWVNLLLSLATQLTLAAAVGMQIGWLQYAWVATIQRFLRQLPLSLPGNWSESTQFGSAAGPI
jgi:hypothetical protein